MKPLLPGQAAVTHRGGNVCLVVCDYVEHIRMGGVSFGIVGGLHQIAVAGVVVPVVVVVIKLTSAGHSRLYVTWIDELAEGVIESLGTQAVLPVILANAHGDMVASASTSNGLREIAHKNLGIISELADRSPWQTHHFAAARVFIEAQHTPESLWIALGGE